MGKNKSKKGSGTKGLSGLMIDPEKPWIQVIAQMPDHVMTLTEEPTKKFYHDAKLFVESTADVSGYYQLDSCTIITDVYNLEIEAMGGKMIYGENSMPTIDFRDPLIKNPEDLRKLKKKEVDWYNDGRLPYALECIDLSLEYEGVAGTFCAPFSMAVGMRSYPALIKDMKKHPEFAHELLTFIVDDVLVPYIKVQNDYTDILMAFAPDAWASVPNLSVKDLKEWVVPYTERLREKCKKLGVMIMCSSGTYCEEQLDKFDAEVLHGCFDVGIACTGSPMIFLLYGPWQDYPLEPVRDYTAKLREENINVTITAGVNARLLRDGPVEKIVDTIKHFIDILGRDHNLSFFLDNIPADAPTDHIHAAVAAIHTYGRLPIADNLDDIEFKIPKLESFKEWKKKLS
jgi:uroporphyrinogen-III decarboxylase